MDSLIFLLIFATLIALVRGYRKTALTLFALSLAATLLLFRHHATDPLPLSF
jgi:hypothetical protein